MGGGRGIAAGRRVDGIRHRVRAGCPWRDVPERYGPWSSLYRVFRRYQREGVWNQVLDALSSLADGGRQICWEVSVDSTITRAHRHAAGARRESVGREPPGVEPADHGLGRSRGGWTTKIHAVCEQGQRITGMVVTAGQRGDSPQFAAVLDQIRVKRPGGPDGCGRALTGSGGQGVGLSGQPAPAPSARDRRDDPDKKDHRANRLARGSKGGRPPKFC
ncbi:IS5 family transposase [Streptomyces sp. NPDC057460]|uniref:IS5 family transposase n=1 Tax=Streptomyces sp. NPDC057460 TaxID=3346141 RepID=UPI003689DEFC